MRRQRQDRQRTATSKRPSPPPPPSPHAAPPTGPQHPSSSTFCSSLPRDGPSGPRSQAGEPSDVLQTRAQRPSNGETSEGQRVQVAQDGVTHDRIQNHVDRGAGDDNEGGSGNDLLASKLSGREYSVNHSDSPSKCAKAAVDSPDVRPTSGLRQAEQASSSSKTGWSSLANELQAKIMR
ncbi:hypothetical protein P7C70_g9116, partial [Phenoliferia sp. Uapishka_3]